MRATLHGSVAGPAAAVVGTWDPFFPDHRRHLEELVADARSAGLSSVAIMLDPPPPLLVWGPMSWPLYDDAPTRLEHLRASGLDGVLLVRFGKHDVLKSAADFLAVVRAHIRLRELWLGALQSLGPGPDGNPAAISRLARRHRFRIRTVESAPVPAREVRQLLTAGRLQRGVELVGRPPARRRPRGERIRLAWAGGLYEAVASANGRDDGRTLAVELRASDGDRAVLEWPDRQIGRLAFVKGPADGGVAR